MIRVLLYALLYWSAFELVDILNIEYGFWYFAFVFGFVESIMWIVRSIIIGLGIVDEKEIEENNN